ncbi:MAG: hypothetical protein ABI614_27410 [Planctomycetota bacterium]
MTRYAPFIASIGSIALSTIAHAHPGHGDPGNDSSLLHYATEPVHLGVGFCLLVGAVLLTRLLWATFTRHRQQNSGC